MSLVADYTTTFTPTSNGPVELTVAVGSTSTNPAKGIAFSSANQRINNDGMSSTLINLVVMIRMVFRLQINRWSFKSLKEMAPFR